MDIVSPTKITSPISGFPVTPKLITRTIDGQIITEAHWIDPQSGVFIRKGIVKIVDAETGEDITYKRR